MWGFLFIEEKSASRFPILTLSASTTLSMPLVLLYLLPEPRYCLFSVATAYLGFWMSLFFLFPQGAARKVRVWEARATHLSFFYQGLQLVKLLRGSKWGRYWHLWAAAVLPLSEELAAWTTASNGQSVPTPLSLYSHPSPHLFPSIFSTAPSILTNLGLATSRLAKGSWNFWHEGLVEGEWVLECFDRWV